MERLTPNVFNDYKDACPYCDPAMYKRFGAVRPYQILSPHKGILNAHYICHLGHHWVTQWFLPKRSLRKW